MRIKILCLFFCLPCIALINQKANAQAAGLGIFDAQTDVGTVKHKGSALYDAKPQQYHLEGSGTNIWATSDAFHFVWKRMKGVFILRTNAAFIGKGVEAHRKIGLMIRTSLDSNSKHVNVVVHGDGLTSLQYRKTVGGITEEQKSGLTGADVIQLERKGNTYTMSVARKGELLVNEEVGNLDLGDEVYVGIFICSHNADVTEKATFNNVRIVVPAPVTLVPYKQYLGSSIELLDLETQNSRVIYQSPKSLQAPNWMQDGKSLIYNSEGLLYKFNLKTSEPVILNTGPAKNNNNDHVLSFDGKMLAISSGDGGPSLGYTVSASGGEAKQITPVGPSYMHGWSPMVSLLCFAANEIRSLMYIVFHQAAARRNGLLTLRVWMMALSIPLMENTFILTPYAVD